MVFKNTHDDVKCVKIFFRQLELKVSQVHLLCLSIEGLSLLIEYSHWINNLFFLISVKFRCTLDIFA